MLRLVPFNQKWVTHDKLDLHAIYRRPQHAEDAYGERHQIVDPETGEPQWDVTSDLPVKQHNKWLAKGYQYVTLATEKDLHEAARQGTLQDEDGNPVAPAHFKQDPRTGAPWNWRKYSEGAKSTSSADFEQLKADVRMFGSDAVETLRKRENRGFALPESLRGLKPGEEPREPARAAAAEAKGGKRTA